MSIMGEITNAPAEQTSSVSVDGGQSATENTFVAPEWAKGLSIEQEILAAPMFKSVKSLDDVVKGYYHAQKMVGADKIVVPNKNSSSDEWKNYFVKAGLPESIDSYKVELPSSFDDSSLKETLTKTAFESNIMPDQLNKVMAILEEHNNKIISDYEASQADAIKATAEELKKEWGQGFDKQIFRAQRVVKHFGGDEMFNEVINSELANNGQFLKLMAKIGEKMTGEDSFMPEQIKSSFGMTKEEAKKKINQIYGDSNSPYFNSAHAQHKDFLEEMLKLQEIVAQN